MVQPAAWHSPTRLGFNDDLFLKLDQAIAQPMTNQVLLRYGPQQVSSVLAALPAFRSALAAGELGRLVVRPRTPLARAYFLPAAGVHPWVHQAQPIPQGGEQAWADRTIRERLDPVLGPPWVLRSAPTSDGGLLISFIFSHVQGDASTMTTAFCRVSEQLVGAPQAAEGRPLRPVLWRDNLLDAIRQGGAVASGLVGVTRALMRGEAVGPPQRGWPPVPERPVHAVPGAEVVAGTSLLVDLAEEEWNRAAGQHGGTKNTLLIAVAVLVLVQAGRVAAGDTVAVSVPVNSSDRGSHANGTVGVVIPATVSDLLAGDLAPLRAASRAAFAGLTDGSRPSPMVSLRPLVQATPDWAVAAASARAPGALLTVSNIGRVPAAFCGGLGIDAERIGMRSVITGASPQQLRRAKGGITVAMAEYRERVGLSIGSADVDRLPDLPAVTEATMAALRHWGLTATTWGK